MSISKKILQNSRPRLSKKL